MNHLRLGILVSGSGTTMQNLAEVIARHELDATVAVCIASNSKCFAIQRAHDLRIPLHIITPRQLDFSGRIAQTLRDHHVDLVLMAGFLSLWQIPPDFTGRVLNIHPALLPKYGGQGMHGRHVHEAVLTAREPESGCTVHFADNAYDHGPIILQRRIPVLSTDSPDSLAARIFEQERLAYPEAIRLYAQGLAKFRPDGA